jgi:molybdate transport system substrate-binding protein
VISFDPYARLSAVVIAAALTAAGPVTKAGAEEILAAVAANFADAAEALGERFAETSGHRLVVTTGSTGKLYAQIVEGAPFHVLMSADRATPERLETEKLAVVGSRFTYAVGKLTLWSPEEGAIGDDPAAALLAPETLYVAIANPDLAPYGVAAREALTTMGVWDDVQPKIALAQNIGQVFSLVDSGAASMGFVAASALDAPGRAPRGSRFDVPAAMHTPLRQDAVILNSGANNLAAGDFMEFLKSADARAIIQAFGYEVEPD